MTRLLLLSLALLAVCAVARVEPAAPPAPGASLREMALFDLHGKRHKMSEVTAKRVVVVFWAFWCDTWKSSLPQLQALYGERDELACEIWTVSVDGTYTAEVRPHAQSIPFPLLLDNGGWRDTLTLRRVPTVMLLNADRIVVKVYEGYPGNTLLEHALRAMR